ncbi:uncharacterized protein LOC142235521 [Haematobia irritans]|uniref:uncharacterized protein LOC142235521 n=1 Tax=Haematobia irritans TaxID=7368 RepID=UPI003F5057B0
MPNGEEITQPSPSLEELKQRRASSKGSMTRIKNVVEGKNILSHTELECRLGIIESYYKQASYYQNQIERLSPLDDGRADIDELYITIKTKILDLIGSGRRHSVTEQSFSVPQHSSSRLPNLKLPKFDGKYLEYKNFINTFNNLVHKDPNIPVTEKFNHLLSCLSGEALSTIKAFQVTDENYQSALDRLKERYDNDTLIFLENVTSMFEISKSSKPVPKQLRNIVDTISALYSSLKSLGSYEQICDAFIIHLAMSKVDPDTKQKWDEFIDYSKLPSWTDCCSMLDRRCQQLDAQCRRTSKQQNPSTSSNYSHNNQPSKQHSLLAKNMTQEIICNHCSKSGHFITTCQRFIVLTPNQRMEQAKQQKLCLNCLAKGHMYMQCPSRYSCRFCKQKHHSLLHKQEEQEETPTTSSASTHGTFRQNSDSQISNVILATALVLIRDSEGNFRMGRALLDSCSQVNFITESFSNSLNLRKSKNPIDILGIGASGVKVSYKTQSTVRSRLNNFELSLDFLISPKITGYHPDENLSITDFNLPNNIELADPEFHRRRGIDMLLGAESFFSLLSVGQIRLGENLPTLQKTLLGWIVSGKYTSNHLNRPSKTSYVVSEDIFSKINNNVEMLWKLESVEGKRQPFSLEQQECENHFIKNEDPMVLGDSRDIALRRFLSIERKLNKNSELKEQYSKFMKEYEELGHMSPIEEKSISSPNYYIPHHCVLRPQSVSTKLRVVFDASCKSSSQLSLNDIMMVGSTIQNQLLITLLRFRCHRYGLTADIEKMYRQVLVHPDDRHLQLILWRDHSTSPIKTYTLNTVTYGTASAPYLAIRSLHYAAEQFPNSHECGKAVVTKDFYVDDMITGADDLHTLQLIKKEVTEILTHSNFSLSKWHSNCPNLNLIDTGIKEVRIDDDYTSTLGISWYTSDDTFRFEFRPSKSYSHNTKRTILSLTSTLFDPMGLISPLIIKSKILLQKLWILKCDWDESVPQEIDSAWTNILADYHNLPQLKISRFIRLTNLIDLQVHGFGDASTKAYGCCLYFRCIDSFGNVVTNLVASKSRVVPLKTRSLPRLELCASHLLAIFWNQLKDHFNFSISTINFWSDSQITLHWIRTHSSTLSTFVGNRVSEIQNLSNDIYWRYIPTDQNPADLVSRGCSVIELENSNWFYGPSFLRSSESEWPPFDGPNVSEEEMTIEKRKTILLAQEEDVPYIVQAVHKFSNYLKCLRIFSYIFRFQSKKLRNCLTISPDELNHSLHRIIWAIQRHYFSNEIKQINNTGTLHNHLSSLALFIQEVDGVELVRVGGRLLNSDLPEDMKFPFLLPKSDPFVKVMINHFHQSNYHAGPRALVSLIQQQFWIINCRSLARQVVYSCIHCTKYKPKLLTQVMGNLPKDRVSGSRPFQVVGVDFAGPIATYLRIRGKAPYKSYIAVFVCFATKAVHLEAVSDLTSDAFIAALKRFIGRRGLPSKIYCDNATNFIGAESKLKEFHKQFHLEETKSKIESFSASKHIQFVFIPPRAPHFGGLWEAAVKSAKSHLFRTLPNARLTFEELSTALVEIEAIMNSRPISPASTDPNDLQALTPGHFLIGCPLLSLPERTNFDSDISHLQSWQRISAVKSHFWRRWHKEYLAQLQHRHKWQTPQQELNVNDMVIVHEDNVPPIKWITGRVTNIVPGADGYARVADVRTPTNLLRRPVAKLAKLPID